MAGESDKYLLALGGNMPVSGQQPADTLRAALDALDIEPLRLLAASPLYETPCFPPGAGPDYVNAAALVEAALTPRELLDHLHRIEARWGRERVQRWGMRTLDIDLIACGDLVLPDAGTQRSWRDLAPEEQVRNTPDRLILPHPRLQDRAFVLVPLNDVAPDWRHPLTGLSVSEMLGNLPLKARNEVKRL